MSATVDDETILEVLRSNEQPRMTTTEVAGHLPVTRGTTRTRLQRLVDDGLLERTTEGNEVVWWLPERADEQAAEAEAEPDAEDEDTAEADTAEAEESDEPAGGEEETDPDETEDESAEVEVTATDQSKAETDDGPTEVEVEAVEANTEPDVETPDAATETRTAADRGDEEEEEVDLPELSDDEEGLRALAAVAVGVVALLVLRRLLGGD
ncbi:winged helix-turn-helix transcriptional regulator [Halosegnis sp.]|uniref:winged helix-turn-helix transcriptional regulator n=1 Tax=Halosegnis sp. TaxID=2864959 RepID=UPI0035D4785B